MTAKWCALCWVPVWPDSGGELPEVPEDYQDEPHRACQRAYDEWAARRQELPEELR